MRRDLRRHVSNGGIFSTALRLRDMYEGSVAIVVDIVGRSLPGLISKEFHRRLHRDLEISRQSHRVK